MVSFESLRSVTFLISSGSAEVLSKSFDNPDLSVTWSVQGDEQNVSHKVARQVFTTISFRCGMVCGRFGETIVETVQSI